MNDNLVSNWMELQNTLWGSSVQQMAAWQVAWMNSCLQMQREWLDQTMAAYQGLPWAWPSVAGAEQLA